MLAFYTGNLYGLPYCLPALHNERNRMTSISRLAKISLCMMLTFMISGCISVFTSIANAPTHLGNLDRKANIAYGAEPIQKLDIYSLTSTSTAPRPVIVFFHGGRWTDGNKEQYRFVAARLAKEGYVVVIPDYEKYPKVKFPAFMEDAARSLVWIHQHIGEYGGDPSQLYLMGHSSGAHMGALLISDPRYLKKYGGTPQMVKAFAGLAGPYDFVPEADDLKDLFGPPSQYPQMQVPTFITGNEPPMLLLYGADDTLVADYNMTKLADAIRAHHGVVETKTYPGMGHFGIVTAFTWLYSGSPVPKDCIAFFRQQSAAK
jgi:acetyl esterase/lipase